MSDPFSHMDLMPEETEWVRRWAILDLLATESSAIVVRGESVLGWFSVSFVACEREFATRLRPSEVQALKGRHQAKILEGDR